MSPRTVATPRPGGADLSPSRPRQDRTHFPPSRRRPDRAHLASSRPPRGESGQALLLVLGMLAVLGLGALVLGGFGLGLGGKGRHQRAADLAAVSAARSMRADYPRLFLPPVLPSGAPNPRHMPLPVYLARARAAAVRGARMNKVSLRPAAVSFPGMSFAPVRVRVAVEGRVPLPEGLVRDRAKSAVAVRARATAELAPSAGVGTVGQAAFGAGGGYDGPLAYRMGKGMRPDVAAAFDRMAAAARREAGLSLLITSAFRSDAEQARLFAANPDPRWVARPGTSLHGNGTELDLGPRAAWPWLTANASRFGFRKRYAWE